MARYNRIFAGAVNKTMPQTIEKPVDVATAPGTLVTINGSGEFIAHATQGVYGAFYLLDKNSFEQADTDTNVPANGTGVGFFPEEDCRFYALVETATNCVEGVTLLTSNGSGALEVAASGDDVFAVADESYNNTTGSNQLVAVRFFKGRVA